jgi:DNA repair protein RadC
MRNDFDMFAQQETVGTRDDFDLLNSLISRRRAGRSSAVISRRLLRQFGGIRRVLRATPHELAQVKGVDDAIVRHFRQTRALMEAMALAELDETHVLDEPEAVFAFCRLLLAGERREQFHVLYLDKAFRLTAHECLQVGTVDHVTVYPREVLGRAIQHAATSIILVHNHPSGNQRPSAGDIAMTRQLVEAGRYLRVDVADHIIVGGGGNFSFRRCGLLEKAE